MPATTLDGTTCPSCGHKFAEDEGRYASNGGTCVPCYESTDITVDIGVYQVPQKLLNEYTEAVEAVRRGTILASSLADPLILMQREQNRIAAHKRIFESVGIEYGDHHWGDNMFQAELDKWLEANTSDPLKGGAA